jgi:hypothetical protein
MGWTNRSGSDYITGPQAFVECAAIGRYLNRPDERPHSADDPGTGFATNVSSEPPPRKVLQKGDRKKRQ